MFISFELILDQFMVCLAIYFNLLRNHIAILINELFLFDYRIAAGNINNINPIRFEVEEFPRVRSVGAHRRFAWIFSLERVRGELFQDGTPSTIPLIDPLCRAIPKDSVERIIDGSPFYPLQIILRIPFILKPRRQFKMTYPTGCRFINGIIRCQFTGSIHEISPVGSVHQLGIIIRSAIIIRFELDANPVKIPLPQEPVHIIGYQIKLQLGPILELIIQEPLPHSPRDINKAHILIGFVPLVFCQLGIDDNLIHKIIQLLLIRPRDGCSWHNG